MESRKRQLAEEDDVPHVKKRIFTGARGSPELNGVKTDSAEPTANDQLEVGYKNYRDGMCVVMPSCF